MNYVVLGNGESAQKLANILGGRNVCPVDLSVRERKDLMRDNKVINWGWSTRWAHVNPLKHWIKDKHRASLTMDEAGVNCSVYNSPASRRMVKQTPFLVRKARHSGGKDVRIFMPFDWCSLEHDDFIVDVFPKEREYRVHVAFGKVIKIQRKNPEYEEDVVWNNDNCHFSRCNTDNPRYMSIKDLSFRAVSALGLDFGAVDVGVRNFGQDDQVDIVFEVNTAPALNENTAIDYATAIRDNFGDEPEHNQYYGCQFPSIEIYQG